ncbi:MAG: NYN domain-containing protein [Gordonibacter sp.]|uniref:NYN domain-containing protein n=1 Tax=Gordonibacter sp. TaxID=1968902 RepID=UPI002FCCB6E4
MEYSSAPYAQEKTAILVDGGFYRKRAYNIFGDKEAVPRADELVAYCKRHLRFDKERPHELYRIFYYDCPPLEGNVFHPLLQKSISLTKSMQHKWSVDFLSELSSKRKVALRLGELQEQESSYKLKPDTVKKLCRNEITVNDLTEKDFALNIVQKGVDMRIGLDIASLAYKKQVSQIVLIAGDSDFVPAAKHARREGIDFILDPMRHGIKPSLNRHIDGLRCCVNENPNPAKEPLHINHIPPKKSR